MIRNFILPFFLLVSLFSCRSVAQNYDFDIECTISPDSNYIKSQVEFVLPSDNQSFTLNNNLKITQANFKFEKISSEENQIATYRLTANPKKKERLKMSYEGIINVNPDGGSAEYARGFSQTPGIISTDGVYIGGSTYWIPTVENRLFTFKLSVHLPQNWLYVSQGKVDHISSNATYTCPQPQEEVYLIAAPFTFYSFDTLGVSLQAFLRTPDKDLADRYLNATAKYFSLYETMLGDYPYSKFALVENFWETGYGMPSFTLLGQKVIRFPFIINSSYPHELLHNYWGNSVYVDYGTGNWCEGITAYMADHMLKEQTGEGAEYRRATLQKYTDFVNAENDFPLTQFISRNNPAQEAVGYGKCLMMNHMLRMKTGDEVFVNTYADFYKNFIYKKAGFNDISATFSSKVKWDVNGFFNQWVERTGAPMIVTSNVSRTNEGRQWVINFTITQTQSSDSYLLDIPVAVYFADTVIKTTVEMGSKVQNFMLLYGDEPLRLEIDPEYDVFRMLDRREAPPTIARIFGSQKTLIVLPKNDSLISAWQTMANTWKSTAEAQGNSVEIVYDNEIDQLPLDKSVWVLGKTNKCAHYIYSLTVLQTQIAGSELNKFTTAEASGSMVYTTNPNDSSDVAYAVIFSSNKAAVAGITRLLPHYGKYSALAFEGSRPSNTAKAIFKPQYSPLHFVLSTNNSSAKLQPAKALVELP